MEHLQQQITRLNLMVDALLAANEALRNENDLLKQQINEKNEQDHESEQRITILNEVPSDAEQHIGINTANPSNAELQHSILQEVSSNSELGIEPLTIVPSNVEQRIGINSLNPSNVEQDIASRNTGDGKTEQHIGINHFQELKPNYQLSPLNISKLRGVLRDNEPSKIVSPKGTYERFAKIILYTYNGGSCTHKALKKLTGLSEGGLAKTIMSMKKRGLVLRQKFQLFTPTGYAKQLIMEAGLE